MKTHDTIVMGGKGKKITFFKSYCYATQKDEAQKDLAFVSDKNNFDFWYISAFEYWQMGHTHEPEVLKFNIPIPA